MRLLASLIFFTRLPWWRIREVPKEAFEHVVDWWPFVGWLTGGVMALVLFLASILGFPPYVAAFLAIASRMLLTGALHEDGLADFCDGFGGGVTRERTLSIMKDSHIGTYGVLGLFVTCGLLWACLGEIGQWTIGNVQFLILLFDVAAKCAASLITSQLPYARTAESAKNGVVYINRSGWLLHALRCAIALSLPIALCVASGYGGAVVLIVVPFVVEYLLMLWMRKRLGGYTGDCCGALFLLCELSLYLVCFVVDSNTLNFIFPQ